MGHHAIKQVSSILYEEFRDTFEKFNIQVPHILRFVELKFCNGT